MITAPGSYGYYLHAHQNAAKAAVPFLAIEVCFSTYVVVMQLQLKYITSCAESCFVYKSTVERMDYIPRSTLLRIILDCKSGPQSSIAVCVCGVRYMSSAIASL